MSTGYEPKSTDTILAQMNNLAHFAADVLGDKFQKLDILPFRALSSLPARDSEPNMMRAQCARYRPGRPSHARY